MALALAPGGAVLLALVARLAQRRFTGDALIDGAPFVAPADRRTQAILTNTCEQLILAVALWPVVGLALGPAAVVVLGAAFGASRILFWAGYAISPPLRAFGFAGGFYATILAFAWAIARLLG